LNFLRQGLKTHWSEIFNEFMRMPLDIRENPGLIKRREILEHKMTETEKDLKLLDSVGEIFVDECASASRFI